MIRKCFHHFAFMKFAMLRGRVVLAFGYCPDCKHCWDPKHGNGV